MPPPPDQVAPAQHAPAGIADAQAPFFFGFGFDDNGDAAGMTWVLDLLRGRGVYATFFMTADYGRDPTVLATWRRARAEGHEIGNHSRSHLPEHGGRRLSAQAWRQEMRDCAAFLIDAGVVPADGMRGFRTPYLEYSDATLAAVAAAGLEYDCSIEEGFEPGQDGGNAFWPYTLDGISPGHDAQRAVPDGPGDLGPLSPHPGLWELPVPAVFVPPDDRCADYGVRPGLRAALKARQPWFDVDSGAITGFDFNLWADRSMGGFALGAAEFLATLLYTVDQRLAGNRAPLLFGSHSGCYVDAWNGNAPGAPKAADRRAAVAAVLDAVRTRAPARIARHADVMDWMRRPTPL